MHYVIDNTYSMSSTHIISLIYINDISDIARNIIMLDVIYVYLAI